MTDTTKLAAVIRAELQRQIPEIYFWDGADAELFDEGEREWSDFQGGVRLTDRFDLDRVAAEVLKMMKRAGAEAPAR